MVFEHQAVALHVGTPQRTEIVGDAVIEHLAER